MRVHQATVDSLQATPMAAPQVPPKRGLEDLCSSSGTAMHGGDACAEDPEEAVHGENELQVEESTLSMQQDLSFMAAMLTLYKLVLCTVDGVLNEAGGGVRPSNFHVLNSIPGMALPHVSMPCVAQYVYMSRYSTKADCHIGSSGHVTGHHHTCQEFSRL